MTLLAILAEVIATLLAACKTLANVRYLYSTSPETVAVDKQDDQVKIIDIRNQTIRARVAARLERWKAAARRGN